MDKTEIPAAQRQALGALLDVLILGNWAYQASRYDRKRRLSRLRDGITRRPCR